VSHCGAGYTLGDIAAEFTVFALGASVAGFTLGAEYIGRDRAGHRIQYFAIAPMRGPGLRKGLIEAAKADMASLTAFEIGLFGWMALMYFAFFPPRTTRTRQPGVLVPDADRDDRRVLHRLAGQRLPRRDQGGHVRDVPRAAAPSAPTSPAADYPQGPVTFQPGGRLSVGHSLAEELDSWN
jgi:hypothetical protein